MYEKYKKYKSIDYITINCLLAGQLWNNAGRRIHMIDLDSLKLVKFLKKLCLENKILRDMQSID